MLIACPACAKRYDITAHPLPEQGRKTRCASCGHSWLATPDEAFLPQLRPYPKRPAPRIIDEDPGPPAKKNADMAAVTDDNNSQDDIDALFGDMDANPQEGGEGSEPEGPAQEDGKHPVLAEDQPGAWQPVEDAAFEELDMGADGAITTVTGTSPAAPARRVETLSDVEAMATRRVQARQNASRHGRIKPRRGLLMAASIALLGCLGVFREQTVRLIPQTAPVYAALGHPVNLTGLDFANVTFHRRVENGVETLLVAGEIRNVSGTEKNLPAVRLALYDAARAPLYEWVKQLDTLTLAGDATARFETRLASPPAGATEIVLRFTERKPVRLGER